MSFRRKMIVFQIVVFVLLGGIIATISLDHHNRVMPARREALEMKAELCVRNLTRTTGAGLAADDRKTLALRLGQCAPGGAEDPDLRFAAVFDGGGQLLASVGQLPGDINKPDKILYPVERWPARGGFQRGERVERGGQVLGTVWVEYSTARLERSWQLLAALSTFGVVLALLSFFLTVIYCDHVARPLREMIAFVHEVANGDTRARLVVTASDELAELGHDLDLMTHRLAESERRAREQAEELAARNLGLREAQSQIVQSEKMLSMGNLVAGVAHEINTPLGSIRSNADVVQRVGKKLSGMLDGQCLQKQAKLARTLGVLERSAETTSKATERVEEIVRSLRTFARLDEAERKAVDLHEGLESTVAVMQHELEGVEVVREYGELPPVECYPGRLNQVFMNLLRNAIQAMNGGGTLTLRTRVVDGGVQVQVEDTGEGMSARDLSRIFDPGYTTRGVGVGTGLGLSIAYRVVQDHGGRIDVKSEEGRGSVFTISLPSWLPQKLTCELVLPAVA